MAALDKDYTLEIKWGLSTVRGITTKVHHVVVNGKTRLTGGMKDCKAFAYDYMKRYPLSNHDDAGYQRF